MWYTGTLSIEIGMDYLASINLYSSVEPGTSWDITSLAVDQLVDSNEVVAYRAWHKPRNTSKAEPLLLPFFKNPVIHISPCNILALQLDWGTQRKLVAPKPHVFLIRYLVCSILLVIYTSSYFTKKRFYFCRNKSLGLNYKRVKGLVSFVLEIQHPFKRSCTRNSFH